MSLISATNLEVTYGETAALTGMDFVGQASESVAILGPSGSGKSTLLQCLAGLRAPDAGLVEFDGRDLYSLTDKVRSAIRLSQFGFVFQSAELIAELTVLENVALPVELNGRSRRKSLTVASSWVDRLGLIECKDRRPRNVSGGQRQRAAIARAMATAPRVVFADEPTGALDTANRDAVLDILVGSCQAQGSLLVLVTHDPVAADRVGRRVHMVDGRQCRSPDLTSTPRR